MAARVLTNPLIQSIIAQVSWGKMKNPKIYFDTAFSDTAQTTFSSSGLQKYIASTSSLHNTDHI